MMYSKEPTWDTPYGNYKDFDPEPLWSDDFNPSREARAKAREIFDDALKDILMDIAIDNHLDPSEWEQADFDEFREIMDL